MHAVLTFSRMKTGLNEPDLADFLEGCIGEGVTVYPASDERIRARLPRWGKELWSRVGSDPDRRTQAQFVADLLAECCLGRPLGTVPYASPDSSAQKHVLRIRREVRLLQTAVEEAADLHLIDDLTSEANHHQTQELLEALLASIRVPDSVDLAYDAGPTSADDADECDLYHEEPISMVVAVDLYHARGGLECRVCILHAGTDQHPDVFIVANVTKRVWHTDGELLLLRTSLEAAAADVQDLLWGPDDGQGSAEESAEANETSS